MIWVALLAEDDGPEPLRGSRWHFSVGQPCTDLIFAPMPWHPDSDNTAERVRWVRVSDDNMRADDERNPAFEPWPFEVVYRIDRRSARTEGAEIVVTYRPLTPPPVNTERTEVVGAGGDVNEARACGRPLPRTPTEIEIPVCRLPAGHWPPCMP